ncbi:MAG TPA: ribosomal protein S18-alanine N-acetyltransferase [Anaeromyxobacteraceae bacterium]|nr:ribosomal protein S18-alanine N-acetyltransferase [Anaeromyxobacteraceae bacterium]
MPGAPDDTEAAPAFRRMRLEDLERVVEIQRTAFAHPWSRELLAREMGHDWSSVLLAVEAATGGEAVLGVVVFWLVHDEVHVLNVAVAPEARRRGVARALMHEAERRGVQRGARIATLEVRRSNQAALELYRSLGYREVGVRPRYYAEEGEDAIIMERML